MCRGEGGGSIPLENYTYTTVYLPRLESLWKKMLLVFMMKNCTKCCTTRGKPEVSNRSKSTKTLKYVSRYKKSCIIRRQSTNSTIKPLFKCTFKQRFMPCFLFIRCTFGIFTADTVILKGQWHEIFDFRFIS